MSMIGNLVRAAAGGDMSTRARSVQFLVMAALFLALALALGLAANGYWLINLTAAFATMLAMMGVSLLFGQLGLMSLCQFALVGVGGWVMLWLFHSFHLPFEISIVLSGFGASVVGVIWGVPALRFRGIYLALVTLMLSAAFQAFIGTWNFPAGGAGGLERVLMERPAIATTDRAYFFYSATVCLLGLVLVEVHRNARPGRTWALIRRSPQLAIASGASIVFYQTWAFALAGFLAGVAGALLAGLYGQLDATGFGASESILLFAASILGGTTNWVGTVIGGLLVRAIPTFLDSVGVPGTVGVGVFGLGLVLAVTFGPTGLAGLFDDLVDRLSRESETNAARAGIDDRD